MAQQQPYPDEQTWWPEVFDPACASRYAQVGLPYPDGPGAFRWASRTAYDIAAGMTKEASLVKHMRELDVALGINQPLPGQATNRPLVGPLRVSQRMFRDDTGWRRVFMCSWFPALRILRDSPAEFERQMDAIAAANYQGIRIFLAVGGWSDFWDGREVAPLRFQKWYYDPTAGFLRPGSLGGWVEAWPDYDDLLRTLVRACRARKLRLHVTTGDMQIICPDPNAEIDLHRRCARICADEGGLEVIALAEATNEFPINRFGGDSQASIDQMGRVLDVWSSAIPGVLTAQGAIPQDEEPASLEKASEFGTVCVSHTTRKPYETCIKHTFGLVYWEGNYRGFPKPFKQGEPAGPGADSFQRLEDPSQITALYAMHALTGQDSNYFNGPSVRAHEPLEATWGFTELPALFADWLPEDIAQWDHGSNQRGGIEYYWRGNNFRTAVTETWDPSPPRTIASWTLYPDGQTGTGTPPKGITGLLVGTFA